MSDDRLGVDDVVDFVALLAALQPAPDGHRFGSIADLVLRYGRIWPDRADPATVPDMARGQCFANAGILAVERPDLTYVEGWAGSLIPTEHAWLVTADGAVVDPTWGHSPDAVYLGVPLTRHCVMRRTTDTGVWGILVEAWRQPRWHVLRDGLNTDDLATPRGGQSITADALNAARNRRHTA